MDQYRDTREYIGIGAYSLVELFVSQYKLFVFDPHLHPTLDGIDNFEA